MNLNRMKYFSFLFAVWFILGGCHSSKNTLHSNRPVKPDYITDKTLNDTDDPAIWIHPTDPMKSLILGTDKGDANGGIYAYDLYGKLHKKVIDLPRPNNIDVEYEFLLRGQNIDIAVFTERNGDKIRVMRLPELTFIDGGGIPVFTGDSIQSPMGIGLYKSPKSNKIFAIVGRKSGPDGSYLWQYELRDSAGIVVAEPVRKFGQFKGGKEIESIVVDDAMGYVYYSDEGSGVRKYHAEPDSPNNELAFFANLNFTEDHEGISIYPTGETTGYILVSDQQANRFHIFKREGTTENPHQHDRIAIIPVSTHDSDGSDVTNVSCGSLYPKGFFVAMSDNKTFQIYNWIKLEDRILQVGH
jgi:3-phytase